MRWFCSEPACAEHVFFATEEELDGHYCAEHELPETQQFGGVLCSGDHKTSRCNIFDDHCFVLDGFLAPDESRAVIRDAEDRGLRSCGQRRFRVADRVLVRAPELAARLFARVAPELRPVEVVPMQRGRVRGLPEHVGYGTWDPVGVNPVVRVCRYEPGGFFLPHHDGGHIEQEQCSLKTLMVYLNEDFEGGPTIFFSERQTHYSPGRPELVLHQLQPRTGQCLVFNHNITHSGGTVESGLKYILRSEVMYRRRRGAPMCTAVPRHTMPQCVRCGESFVSRNALFKHLRHNPGHVVLNVAPQ